MNKREEMTDEVQAKNQRLRTKIIDEIISSEQSYINHLTILLKHFIEPVQSKQLLNVKETRMLFGSIEQLMNVNLEFLKQCESNREDIGRVFLELTPFFKMYVAYSNGYEEAMSLLRRVMNEKDGELTIFLNSQETRPEVGMKINALLITPIQRIPRYKLLLEELLQVTPCESENYKILLEACQQVTLVAESINDCLREQQNMQHMLRIQNRLTKGRPKIVIPGRKFIKEGVLRKVSRNGNNSQKRIFFLFNDMLMYCKPRGETLDCCYLTPLRSCIIETLFDCSGAETKKGVLFKLICAGEELMLYTNNVIEGESWVCSINSTISMLNGNRQTLRKESSRHRPLRRKGILKQQKPQSLSSIHFKRHLEAKMSRMHNNNITGNTRKIQGQFLKNSPRVITKAINKSNKKKNRRFLKCVNLIC